MKKKLIVLLVACVVAVLLLCLCLCRDERDKYSNTDMVAGQEMATYGDATIVDYETATCEASTFQHKETTEFLLEEAHQSEESEQEHQVGQHSHGTVQAYNTEQSVAGQTAAGGGQEADADYKEESQPLIPATTHQDTGQASAEHTHSFQETIEVIHHPEVGHYEEYCVSEGYIEEQYVLYNYYCYSCGEIMDDWDTFSILEHSGVHGAYGSKQVVVETIEHPAVYEQVWIVDKEEYKEEVITRICSQCGYIQ